MKKLVLFFVMVLGATKMSAQYYNPMYSSSYSDSQAYIQMLVMQNAQLAQMRAQTAAMQMQYMQQLQANAAAAAYNMMYNPFGSSNVSGSVTREKVTCSSCNGTRRVTRQKADYVTRRMRTVHEMCPDCHGRGYTRE